MRHSLIFAIACTTLLSAQTAEELTTKNLKARGAVEKLKEIRTLRKTGKTQQGSFTAPIGEDWRKTAGL